MQDILNFLDSKYVDWTMFLLVLASGFFQQRLLKPFVVWKADKGYDQTLKTFLVSVVFCTVYILLWKYNYNQITAVEEREGAPWIKFFISFGLATSFYDIILRLFKKKAKDVTGFDIDNNN